MSEFRRQRRKIHPLSTTLDTRNVIPSCRKRITCSKVKVTLLPVIATCDFTTQRCHRLYNKRTFCVVIMRKCFVCRIFTFGTFARDFGVRRIQQTTRTTPFARCSTLDAESRKLSSFERRIAYWILLASSAASRAKSKSCVGYIAGGSGSAGSGKMTV
jgi:hypothetical protein